MFGVVNYIPVYRFANLWRLKIYVDKLGITNVVYRVTRHALEIILIICNSIFLCHSRINQISVDEQRSTVSVYV